MRARRPTCLSIFPRLSKRPRSRSPSGPRTFVPVDEMLPVAHWQLVELKSDSYNSGIIPNALAVDIVLFRE